MEVVIHFFMVLLPNIHSQYVIMNRALSKLKLSNILKTTLPVALKMFKAI